MPLASIHLVQLSPGASIRRYIDALTTSSVKPIVISRCVRWIIKPEKLTVPELLEPLWDLFIVLPSTHDQLKDLIRSTEHLTTKHWSLTVGIPSRVLEGFAQKNDRLLHPHTGDIPELTGSMAKPRIAQSTQGLELNDELLEWSKTFTIGQNGAVSMLNLLAFKPEKGADDSYKRYGKAFSESIGRRRGGEAKLVGKVVPKENSKHDDNENWAEFALAHYPSIRHFVDMIASDDYQEVNHRDRLPSLEDTCILCTTELDPELWSDKSKL